MKLCVPIPCFFPASTTEQLCSAIRTVSDLGYTAAETYESTQRLYQLEEMLEKTTFARISKTAIANLSKMRSIKPIGGSRLVAAMVNGEKVQVSRAYVQEIKRKLGV